MPLAAVFVVLLTVASIFAYAVPVTRARVSEYARDSVMAEATAAGRAVAGTDAGRAQELLDYYVRASDGQALLVNRGGEIVARTDDNSLETSPDLLRRASQGARAVEDVGNLHVAIAPVIYQDELSGGVILASGNESRLFWMALRGSLEAAVVASVLGGGLMFLLAALLSRRIGRISSGARAIEQGDLGHRIEPGPDDELGELAGDFNSMAGQLERYIVWLEAERDARHTLLDNLTEGVAAATPDGRILFANKAARRMLRLDDGPEPEELPDLWDDFSLPAAAKRCVTGRDCPTARVESGEALLQVSLRPLPGFGDDEDGVLVVIQNLSERRRLEADQQRFIGKAAHELKTPITAIVGAAELLASREKPLEPEVRRNLLGYILSEGRRMQRLSDTMLRLARTGWDSREPVLQEVDLVRAARRSAERIEPLAQSAGVTVRVEDGVAGRALADPEWLEQALLILLNNAVQHSDAAGSIRLEVADAGITVADDGRGIDPGDLPHIFEGFYSGRQSAEGFGLGLAICKELVERMGANVSASSEEGAGARFELTFARPGEASVGRRRK